MLQLRRDARTHGRRPQARSLRISRSISIFLFPFILISNFVAIDAIVPRMNCARPQPVIPAVPRRGRDYRRRRMPRAISYDSLPLPTSAVVIIPINEPFIAGWAGILSRSQHINGFRSFGAIEVPHIDFAVVRAGVNIAAVCGSGRRKVAADERLEDAVAAECDEGAVVGVRRVVFGVVGREAIVEACSVVL